jgi:hypothetical protein
MMTYFKVFIAALPGQRETEENYEKLISITRKAGLTTSNRQQENSEMRYHIVGTFPSKKSSC